MALPRDSKRLGTTLRSVAPCLRAAFPSMDMVTMLNTWADEVETVKRACLLVPSTRRMSCQGAPNQAGWRLRRAHPWLPRPPATDLHQSSPHSQGTRELRPQLPPLASPPSARQKSWCFEQTSSFPLAFMCITRNFPLRIPCWGLGCPGGPPF